VIVLRFNLQGEDTIIEHTNVKCHEATLIMKLLVTNVTHHMPQNRVSNIVKHVTHIKHLIV
jgi:hypothetical protein